MIILPDCHLHTSFSTDSDCPAEAIIEKALSLGISTICFTDHNDFDYPKENGQPQFQLDYFNYISHIEKLRQTYQERLTVLTGVEQGLSIPASDRINSYDSQKRLDFIIGSSHLVYGDDPYYPEYWDNYSVEKGITRYYESILDNLQCCTNFDVYGHLDYIIRYAPGKDSSYNWNQHKELIEAILKKLISSGKGIEINSAGLRYGLKSTNPDKAIIAFYKQLGGEIITIGSDSHYAKDLGGENEYVNRILNECGFKYYTIFKNRQPYFYNIK